MNMNAPIKLCDSSQMDLLLQSKLSTAEEDKFILHLNSCESCRHAIEKQAAEPETWQEAEKLLKPSIFDLPEPASDAHSTGDGLTKYPHQIQMVLSTLGPTDFPDMLGRLGGYEVSGVVGAGGMGVVLKAIDKSLDRVVAIKVLAPHLAASGSARKRFAREAKAAAAVLHSNVIAIHSVSNDEALPYLVMPYLRGCSLQKRLDQQGPLSTNEILRIGSQVAAGLAAAHAQGLVHRDIKPANILLEDGVERVTLTDFGLARAVDDATITHSGVIAGTPQYMSPEQARGEPVEQRSDLFSLGSVLYAICTGRPPFRAETTYGVMRRIADEEPSSVREINPDIPEWLCRIIAKLMAKRAENRYGTAAEVAQLLEECLAHVQHPSTVPLPVSLFPRPSFFNSHRKGITAMLVTFGFSLLGMVLWQTSEPPDIAGDWVSEEWGNLFLESKKPERYEGTILGATHDGTMELNWSRLDGRFNGTWKQSEDLAGKLSLRVVDNQIRGAWTTNKKSEVVAGTPRLSDFIWKRKSALQDDTTKPNVDQTNARVVAEAYIAAAIKEDMTTCASFGRGMPADTKQITEISNNLNVKKLPLRSVYVDDATKPYHALAISVPTFLNGHEIPLGDRVNIPKDAVSALTKFSEKYEKVKQDAKSELDKLRRNPDLIWRDGKPQDPALENIARCMESISEIDGKIKTIEAVMQQIGNGREANRPLEELLRLALNSTNDNGSFRNFAANDLNPEMDIARNLRTQIDHFESDRVIPLRDILDQLLGQSLGDSHPSVITARNRLDKYEKELARRKAELKKMEEASEKANGNRRKDYLSVESRIQAAFGVLQETHQKLTFEKGQFKAEADALKDKMKENQSLISNYAINLADLNAVKEISDEINKSLQALFGEAVTLDSLQPYSRPYVSMVLSLTLSDERWYVTEVEFETEEAAIAKQKKFLEDNPKANAVLSPATR